MGNKSIPRLRTASIAQVCWKGCVAAVAGTHEGDSTRVCVAVVAGTHEGDSTCVGDASPTICLGEVVSGVGVNYHICVGPIISGFGKFKGSTSPGSKESGIEGLSK